MQQAGLEVAQLQHYKQGAAGTPFGGSGPARLASKEGAGTKLLSALGRRGVI
jgi:hypothetical protein